MKKITAKCQKCKQLEGKRGQIAQKLNTDMFFAGAVKCFDKLWLKDCLSNMIQTH